MSNFDKSQRTIFGDGQQTIGALFSRFLKDRRAAGRASGTIRFYHEKLGMFLDYCNQHAIEAIDQVTPEAIRDFIDRLVTSGHKMGGVHAVYRSMRAFFIWYEFEYEPFNWRNPMKKVKPPKVNREILKPVDMNDLKGIVSTCKKGTYNGDRDYAILLTLLDTGCRASEFLGIQIEDVDFTTGTILIRKGKGGKPRTVFMSKKTRLAVRSYLKHRETLEGPLWVAHNGEPISYGGLRSIVRRRAELLGIEPPSLHSFRSAFALESLRNGSDIYSLQTLMGHSDLQVLRQYLKQTEMDLKETHNRTSPVDHAYL